MQPPTLGQALDLYLTTVTPYKKGWKQEARRIRTWQQNPLADRPLHVLRGADFARWRTARIAAGASCSTARLDLAIVSNLYTVAAQDWGYERLKNPIKAISKGRVSRSRERRLLPGEETRLLAWAEILCRPLKTLILLALDTCMRRSEICGILWQNVNLERRTLLLPDTKNGEPRTVPLTTRACALLAALPRTGARVFTHHPNWVSRRFHALCKAAGITGLRFHDLRHEAISRLFELGIFNVVEIARITRHKTVSQLNRYTHLNAAALAARLP
jgi:integrase